MKRKDLILIIVFAGLLIGLTLIGCGGGVFSKPQTETETPEEPAEPKKPVKKVEKNKVQPQVEVAEEHRTGE